MLKALREGAGWSTREAAEFIGKHPATYRKFEGRAETISKGDLRALVNEWGLEDDEVQVMIELCDQAKQSDWTSKLRLTEGMRRLLGFEAIATAIKAYEGTFVCGALQTEEYARSIIRAVAPEAAEEVIAKAVSLRMERQQRNFGEAAPRMRLIQDEYAIRKTVGGKDVMIEQLQLLRNLDEKCELKVLPLRGPAHPGMLGSFWIFDFPQELSPAAVYAESHRTLYLTDSPTVNASERRFELLWESSLSPEDSDKLILEEIEELER